MLKKVRITLFKTEEDRNQNKNALSEKEVSDPQELIKTVSNLPPCYLGYSGVEENGNIGLFYTLNDAIRWLGAEREFDRKTLHAWLYFNGHRISI